MAITFTHNTPVLPVADVAETQTYYRDVLGFTIDWRQGDQFGGVSAGTVSLFFQKSPTPSPGFTCVLNTPDADAVHQQYLESGANIVDPIATRPWGMREFTVEDLNGHRLRIGHVDESLADYGDFQQNA